MRKPLRNVPGYADGSNIVALPTPVVLGWLTFLAGATFFALMVPLGEGFDEPWHFAYVQHVAQLARPPLGPSTHISREIATFLRDQPVSWELHRHFPTMQSYEEYWKDPKQREEMDRRFATLRFSNNYTELPGLASNQYESHQPPLYYYVVAPMFAIVSRFLSFAGVFTATRMLSIVLASFVVPGSFWLGKMILKDTIAASNVAASLVLFPGLYPDVVRVSNDALAVPLACWALFFLLQYLEKQRLFDLYVLSLFVVVGLWTKAFFIPILGAIVFCLLYYRHIRATVTVLISSLLGTPWYLSNLIHTGSLTGLPETVGTRSSFLSSIDTLRKLNWENLFNVVRRSHIWVGNWSFLSVREWMYQVIFWMFVLAILGLIRGRIASRTGVFSLVVCYVTFLAALVYYAIQVFQAVGTSVAEGWYLTLFTVVEAVLFTAGLQSLLNRRWYWGIIAAQVFLLSLLLYTSAFVEMPYYSGITFHRADGGLVAYHPHAAEFSLMSARLLRFHPLVPTTLPWLLLSAFGVFCVYSIADLTYKMRNPT